MSVQLATSSRDAGLEAYETDLGTSPLLEGFSGAQPANAAAADSGTKLFSMTLPADFMAAASGGTKAKSGTWEDLIADATGTLGHFRLKTSGGVCKQQGSIGVGSGDLQVLALAVTAGQVVRVTSWVWTSGNA